MLVEPDIPPGHPVEQRIRSAAAIAKSHGGLRFLLEVQFAEQYGVSVWETVGGVTTVRLVKRGP